MKRAKLLVDEIRRYCAQHADAKAAARYQRYFREGYDAWGLLDKGNPFFTAKRDEWLDRYRDLGARGLLEAGELLFAGGKFEEGAIAIQFLAKRRDELTPEDGVGVHRWFAAGIGNWAHTDGLCGEILSPMLEDGRLTLDLLAAWRASPHRFQRRAVPVSMLALLDPLRKGATPPASAGARAKRLLAFLRPMMLDDERVVQQGLGWFLRECWKRHPDLVEPFLLEHKDRAGRVIYQYATEKMTAEAKARFRADKPAARRAAAGRGRR